MTRGSPDWTQKIEITINQGQPSEERAAGGVGRYDGTSQTPQTVVSWTVATGYVGELKEILIICDDYDHAEITITVGDVDYSEDWVAQGAMPLIFEDLRLAAATVVLVQAESDDGTNIVVDAVITAKEILV